MGDEIRTQTAGAAAGPDRDFPQKAAAKDLVEPAPRRVRGLVGGELVVDTTRAPYVWEWSHYPQCHIPVADVAVQHLTR